MKAIIALAALLVLAAAQHPVPLPIKNATVFDGIWYAVWGFDSANDNTVGNNISCLIWDVSITENGYAGRIDEYLNDTEKGFQNFTRYFHVEDNGGEWHIFTETWAWVAVDPIAGNWGTIADEYHQRAMILSRSNNLTNVIANAQVLLLQGEGYAINSTNTLDFSNAGCPILSK